MTERTYLITPAARRLCPERRCWAEMRVEPVSDRDERAVYGAHRVTGYWCDCTYAVEQMGQSE